MLHKAITNNYWDKTCSEDDFKQIFRHYYAPLCAYALNYLKQKTMCEGVVQDVFMKLWEHKKRLKINQLKPYLYRSVQHHCLHHIEHHKVIEKHQKQVQKAVDFPSPEQGIIQGEMYHAYQQELDKLPANTREIFQLSRQSNLKYSEIAERLNVSIKTVEAHISKALKAFKIRFDKINKYHNKL